MIKGQIIIKLSDGSIINYANKYLKKKRGSDNATPSNEMYEGFPEYSYYYTGYGDDTYEKQSGAGTIKADYEFLTKQIDTVGDNILEWPESSTSKKAVSKEGEGDTVLIRSISSTINSRNTFSRIKVLVNEIVSINIVEQWVTYPFGKESGYQLPKSSPHFRGFAESKETPKSEKGPDFNKYWNTENDYIPRPSIYLDDKNNFVIDNENSFDEIIKKKTATGWSCYGIRNVTNEYGVITRRKNSATAYADFHPIIYTIARKVNNADISEFKDDIIKVEEGEIIDYGKFGDTETYLFKEWTLDKEGKNKELPETADKDFEIFAQWETKSYTVTKDLNYDSLKPTTEAFKVGASIDYGIPARAGYILRGWFLDPEGKEIAPDIMGTKDFTAYAVWEKIPETPVTKTTKKTVKKTTPKVEPKVEAALEPIDGKE